MGLKTLVLHSLPLKDKTPTITLSSLKRILSLKFEGFLYNKHEIHIRKAQKCTTYHLCGQLIFYVRLIIYTYTKHIIHLGLSFSTYKKGTASYDPIHRKHLTKRHQRNIKTYEMASHCWIVVGVSKSICWVIRKVITKHHLFSLFTTFTLIA